MVLGVLNYERKIKTDNFQYAYTLHPIRANKRAFAQAIFHQHAKPKGSIMKQSVIFSSCYGVRLNRNSNDKSS